MINILFSIGKCPLSLHLNKIVSLEVMRGGSYLVPQRIAHILAHKQDYN